jgi:hypothetical protein
MVTPEPGEPAGRARAIGNECNKPHPRQGAAEGFLVKGESTGRGNLHRRHPARYTVDGLKEHTQAFCDLPLRAPPRRPRIRECAPDDQVKTPRVDPVIIARSPEISSDGAR